MLTLWLAGLTVALLVLCVAWACIGSGSRDLPAPDNVVPFPDRLREVGDEFDRIDPAPWPTPIASRRIGGFRAEDFTGDAA